MEPRLLHNSEVAFPYQSLQNETMRYRIHRKGPAFGDLLLASLFTNILNDNGIPSALDDTRTDITDCLDVPLYDGADGWSEWRFSYRPEAIWDGRGIIRKAIDNFTKDFKVQKFISITRRNVAVRMIPINDVPAFDVIICSKVGHWSPYRAWPFFSTLKLLLDRAKVSWLDISTSNINGNLCLNYVSRAKLYLGLETGTSHFVSGVVNKGLIIQSGYSNPEYWSLYPYEFISRDIACKNCFLTHSSLCDNDHRCMTSISPQDVAARVLAIVK